MSKKEWGNITWILFHSIAEKIQDDKFLLIKQEVIDIITGICRHLPCQDCSEHATNLLNISLINNINDKLQLKEFLRQFHNKVNIKLNKPTYTLDQVNELYKNPRLNIIITNFIIIFRNQAYNEKLIMESFHRKRFINQIIEKIRAIRQYLL